MVDDDVIFKALADATRRFLLDQLFERDGRTLTELESVLQMTRFGVMKHLRVLEAANLIVSRRSGREKHHFLNPVPIRLIHDRWIDKYTEPQVTALVDLKRTLEGYTIVTPTNDPGTTTTQVHRVYIRATADAIWAAITQPEWTNRYGYTGYAEYELRPGGAYRVRPNEEFQSRAHEMGYPCPEMIIDGEVLAVEAPHKLVTTWRMLMNPAAAAEGFTTLTYEIQTMDQGYCSLTITHDLTGAPNVAALVRGQFEGDGAGGGWSWVLSDLKSLLETGKPLAG